MEIDFYDRVAEKFGNYSAGVEIEKEYAGENPEEVFKNYLYKYSGPDRDALDVGCADGRFTLSIADQFKKIVAIDTSEGMLMSANGLQKDKGIENVIFKKVDLFNNHFFDSVFDVIYSRRGPTDYSEFERLLVGGGYYIGIKIGEQDAQGIKEVFGRGQGYGKFTEPVLDNDLKELKKAGLICLCGGMYTYTEYYKSSVDLSRFLESVPIFEDYDPILDRDNLAKYIATHKTEKGIALPRQRIVLVAQKK